MNTELVTKWESAAALLHEAAIRLRQSTVDLRSAGMMHTCVNVEEAMEQVLQIARGLQDCIKGVRSCMEKPS